MEEVTTRTIDAGGMTAARAYAALRAKAPTRTSFLLEEPSENRSTVGFLIKSECAYPPATNVLAELAKLATEMPAKETSSELSLACFRDVLMLIAFDAVRGLYGAAPWQDQPYIGREMRDMASLVFDGAAGKISIVATNPNVVERIARVIADAPPLVELPPQDGLKPEFLLEGPPDPTFAKQLSRAGRRLSMGGLSKLMLPRTFSSQAHSADLFDVYRALRDLDPARHALFVDMPQTHLFGAFAVAAVGGSVRKIEAGADSGALLSAFSVGAHAGAPEKDALRALTDLDVGAYGMRGGLFSRVHAGGAVTLWSTDHLVFLEEGQLQTNGVAEVVPERSAEAHTEAALADAMPALSAIRRAQNAASIREAAAGEGEKSE